MASSALAATYNMAAPILPDPTLSPGDVLTSDPAIICKSGYTQTVRNVPQSLKNQIYKAYGITSRLPGEYEIDHIISLELGGSNSAKNLFPESFKTQPLNAHVKDTLENKLHALACAGTITMQEAQRAIASNWTTAYVKYVGPLPGGVSPVSSGPASPPVPTTVQQIPAQLQGNASMAPLAGGSCPPAAPVKLSKAGIYHLPIGDSKYGRTHATQCFKDAASAAAAGFRGVK
ncbi:hypothetical protein GCM10008957_51380 [Deinococcus ruber]|uniref:HNH endonuclease n=1 Tax=Deinococcus ruber TaxID=1848197 RepID=A0A918FFR1_9DEIO|nr:hypothetical protein GCM10008957_51380 [Deinococcus ruber]